MMTDQELQTKLDQLTAAANQLYQEAVNRYGNGASLFYESGGAFYIMKQDGDWNHTERQNQVTFQSNGYCNMDCGSW